jgi:hypothetical protein
MQLHYLWRDENNQLRSHATVNIITLALRAKLDAKFFQRK